MEPQILALLQEVPADFRPTFPPKGELGRVVGTLDDLDADTRNVIVALHCFLAQGNAVLAAHKLQHEQPGFQKDVEECRRITRTLDGFQEKIVVLEEAADAMLAGKFKVETGERIKFCAEGVVAVAPEPEDPFQQMLRSLSDRGVTVVSISVGPGGPIDVNPTSAETLPGTRSFLDRLLGR